MPAAPTPVLGSPTLNTTPENDLYFGFAGTFSEGIGYDLGYLYYNYDEQAGFDFGEIYGTLTVGNLALKAFFLTNAEPDEVALGRPDWDFAALETFYFSGDYSIRWPAAQ